MAGWRAKLGVIIPSCNTIMEPELYRMAPPGVTFHFSRVHRASDGSDGEEGDVRMVSELPRAASELREAKVDALAWGCTGGSFFRGAGYDRELARSLEEQIGVPATTTSTAVVEALNALSVKRVAVLAPYPAWMVERLRAFLEQGGLTVVALSGLGIADASVIANISSEQTYRLARDADRDEAEAVFISCTDYPTIEVIASLEHDLGKPVISSNTATQWMLLRLAKVRERVEGMGRLLQAS